MMMSNDDANTEGSLRLKSTRTLRLCFYGGIGLFFVTILLGEKLIYITNFLVYTFTTNDIKDTAYIYQDIYNPIIELVRYLNFFGVVLLVVSYFLVMLRFYDNAKKLADGANIKLKKYWCVVGWIIPLLHLYIPYKIMSFICKCYSDGDGVFDKRWLYGWWATILFIQIVFALLYVVTVSFEWVKSTLLVLRCLTLLAFMLQIVIFEKLTVLQRRTMLKAY